MNSHGEPSSAPGKFIQFLAAVFLGLAFTHVSGVLAVEPFYNYPPTVKTEAPGDIGRDYAILSGEANPQGSETQVWFEYGSSPAPALWSLRSSYSGAGKGFSGVNKIFWLSGLRPDTTYYYRAVAQNRNATVYGAIMSFKAEPVRSAIAPVAPVAPSPSLRPTPKDFSPSISPRVENLFRSLSLKKAESSPELRTIETKARPTFVNLLLLSVLTVVVYFILRK